MTDFATELRDLIDHWRALGLSVDELKEDLLDAMDDLEEDEDE